MSGGGGSNGRGRVRDSQAQADLEMTGTTPRQLGEEAAGRAMGAEGCTDVRGEDGSARGREQVPDAQASDQRYGEQVESCDF